MAMTTSNSTSVKAALGDNFRLSRKNPGRGFMRSGFGFATALTSAGLPRHDLPLALLSFNVGVEVGQLGFVALVLAMERSFRVLEVRWPRWVQALPGYTVGTLGAFWTIQRIALLVGVLR